MFGKNNDIKPWEIEKYKYMPQEEPQKEEKDNKETFKETENKENEKLKIENVGKQQTLQEPSENFEAKSYSKRTYEKIARLRERAKMFRFDVPKVGYQLTKPKKPRVLYIILGILCFVLAAALVGLTLFAGISTIPALAKAGSGTGTSGPDWDIFNIIGNLASGVANFAILFAILLIIGLLVGLGFLIFYLIRSGFNCFDLSRATMEEMGYSPLVNRSIYRLGLASAVILAVYITMIVVTAGRGTNFAFSIGGIIVLCVLAFLLSILIVTLVYKFKAQKWVKENISQEHQENYLAHAKALGRVIRKNEMRKSMENMGRW